MASGIRRGDWPILACAFSVVTVTYSVWYSFAVFLVAMGKDLGWTRSELGGAFSVFVITQSLGAPLAGMLADRLSPRLNLRAGALFVALGLFFASRATQTWEFYASFGIIAAIGVSASGIAPIVSVLTKRFKGNLGLVLGIATAGTGASISVLVPLCQYFIISYGWRTAYLLLAFIVVLVLGPASFLFKGIPVRQIVSTILVAPRPAVASATKQDSSDLSNLPNERDWSVSTAIRSTKFWLFFGTYFAVVFSSQLVLVHQIAYLIDIGYPEMLAASTVGLIGLVSIPAKVGWGITSDRIGRELSFTIGSACMVAAVALLLLLSRTSPVWLAYLQGVVFAIGYAVTAPLPPAITADLFPGKNLGSIWGVMHQAAGLAAAIGPLMGGLIFDAAGSYFTAFSMAAVLAAVGATAIWVVAPGASHSVRVGGKSAVQAG